MELLWFIFSAQTVEAVVIYILLAVIALTFLVNLLHLDKQVVQKMVGGLSVLIIAFLSRNPWAISIALFIGGLIIASEEFMAKLAIIMRSESKDLGTNVASLSTASKSEVQSKTQAVALELAPAQSPAPPTPSITKNFASKTIEAKNILIDYLQEKYSNDKFQILPDQKIEDQQSKRWAVVDGVITQNETGTSDIVRLVEVVYVGKITSTFKILNTVRRRAEQLWPIIPNRPIIFYLVVDSSLRNTDKLAKLLLEINEYRLQATVRFFFEVGYIHNHTIEPVTKEISFNFLTKP